MKPRRALLFIVGLSVASVAVQAGSPELATLIRERDATLARIVSSLEERCRNGGGDEQSVFAARLALATFRRDVAATPAEKIARPRAIVVLREEQLANVQARAKVGLSDAVGVLTATDELLAAKQTLLELAEAPAQ